MSGLKENVFHYLKWFFLAILLKLSWLIYGRRWVNISPFNGLNVWWNRVYICYENESILILVVEL